MTVNRYIGSTGQRIRVEEPAAPERSTHSASTPQSPGGMVPLRGSGGAVFGGLGSMLDRAARRLDTEDIILMLMLYLLYRESGDDEWLLMIGALLFT